MRNHYIEISKQCREDDEAVIITVNGRGEAEDDVKNGRLAPVSETFDDLRRKLQEGIG